jgi:hypothetical protein
VQTIGEKRRYTTPLLFIKKIGKNSLAKNSMLDHESHHIDGTMKKLLNSLVISLIRPLSKQWQEIYEQ